MLSSLGQAVRVQQRDVLLPGGGVSVLGACNGLDLIAQLLCVAALFALVFPLRSRRGLALLAAVIPGLGVLINTLRVALLAVVAGAGQGKGSFWFDFFHDQAGSLLFSGVATVVLGWLYLQLLERQLAPRGVR